MFSCCSQQTLSLTCTSYSLLLAAHCYFIVDCSRIHAHFPFHALSLLNASLPFAPLLHFCCFMHITHLLLIFLSYILRSVCTHFLSLVLIINAFTHSLVPAPCSTAPLVLLLGIHFPPMCCSFFIFIHHVTHAFHPLFYTLITTFIHLVTPPHLVIPTIIILTTSHLILHPLFIFSLLLPYILLFSSIPSYIFGTIYIWPSSVILWLFAVFVSPHIIS